MNEGKKLSNRKLSKRKNEAELISDADKSLHKSKKECLKSLEDWKMFKNSN